MSTADNDKTLFEQVDANQDGKIDKAEFHEWLSGNPGDSSTTVTTTRLYQDRPDLSALNRYEHTILTSESARELAIYTRGIEETETYLRTHGIEICRNANVVRRKGTCGLDSHYEQRILLRYLRPPTPPRPGPLIIEEIEEQLPPAPPLIIREQPVARGALPPLVLRERPPIPPAILPSETRSRRLPPRPAPPQSVVIERCPVPPPKPRDIIIERWLPYGPPPEREVIVRKVGNVVEYAKPTCTIVEFETPALSISRKFEVLDVIDADPVIYAAQYKDALLDSVSLVQTAREAGVLEDISASSRLSIETMAKYRSIEYPKTRSTIYESSAVSGASGAGTYHVSTSGAASNVYYGRTDDIPLTRPYDPYGVTTSTTHRREYTTGDGTVESTYTTRSGRMY